MKNDQIISTGYTGAPRGMSHCIDVGGCLRKEKEIPQGERYELCRSVHAEMNAMIHAARLNMVNSSLYLVGVSAEDNKIVENAEPCKMCKRFIINAGIRHVLVGKANDYSKVVVESWVADEERYFYGDDQDY